MSPRIMGLSRIGNFRVSLQRFARDVRGATAILFSLGSVVLTGSIAFGIDAASWYQTDQKLQNAVDMASLAAAADQALQDAADHNGESLETVVRNELIRNGIDPADLSSLVVNSPPSSGSRTGDPTAVEVIALHPVNVFLSRAFVAATPEASARGVARARTAGNFCVLTLHPSYDGAVTFSGSTAAFLGCGVASNSDSASSIHAYGSSYAEVTDLRAVGGIVDGGNIDSTSAAKPFSNPLANPYADLDVPPAASCDYNNTRVNGTDTLDPGVYCGSLRINANANVTFNPGTYVLDDADFTINANTDVFGAGVTFIFTNSSDPSSPGEPNFNGSATIDFEAPTVGDYSGILFMQDPDADDTVGSSADRWLINGNSSSRFHGVFYVPQTEVDMSGSATFDEGCVHIIAGAVTFTGNFEIVEQCDDPDFEKIGAIEVTLAE